MTRFEEQREVLPFPASPEVAGWIRELRGETPAEERTPEEWEKVMREAVEVLTSATRRPGSPGPGTVQPWLVLDEIAHRMLDRSAAARRTALSAALRARWDRADGPSERIPLLGLLALVGEADSVPFLSGLLRDGDFAIREHALRALEENPSPEAEEAIATELSRDEPPAWRLALANGLGARVGKDAEARLRNLVAAERDAEVRASLEAALARFGGG